MFGVKKSNSMQPSTSVIDTLIGESCIIKGDIVCDHSIKIEGQVFGNILSKSTLIVSKNALVKGEIHSDKLIVHGKIEGNIQVDSLELKSTALLQGDIVTKVFQCEAGSVYKGKIAMEHNDLLLENENDDQFDQVRLPNK